MNISFLNSLTKTEAQTLFTSCCGSSNWVEKMLIAIPFTNEMQLVETATKVWYDTSNANDWLEAFNHHPKIGDIKSLSEKFASTAHLAGNEQSSVESASIDTIQSLADANQEYEEKFGFIFIVCATGKSANEMLRLLQDRIGNTKEEELSIAMGEQCKISLLRLKKILIDANWPTNFNSHVTTHVLDTSIGKPGFNITIQLKSKTTQEWQTIAQGVTNADGRIADLLPFSRKLATGNYKMVFNTGKYFVENKIKGFYPTVEIDFTVFDHTHYHIPLLINPYGYSTYRGS
jgi:5-hydroxyisourate hydrolase/2-oxo-4-hydroxy-4-carboxy-5-ureidoimidazoline decarboxylase